MMATADLITAFLSNEMSPERERQFLLSVAASDALRLELKSHLMVDRILNERVQHARVPEGVRSMIFAQAGIATLMAANAEASPATEPAATSAVDRAPAPRGGFFSRLAGRVTIVAAAASLFGAGYFVGNDGDTPNVAARPSSTPASNIDRVADPRTAEQRSDTRLVDEAVSPTTELPRVTSSPRTTPRVSERRSNPTNAASPSSIASVPTDRPSTTAAPTVQRDSRHRRFNQPQTVGVEGSISKPTEEQRNAANPIDPDGGK
jgi:hypothetical protein